MQRDAYGCLFENVAELGWLFGRWEDWAVPYFATTYRYIDDAEKVNEIRPIHREYLAGLTDRGELQVSGPYAGGEPGGALLVFVAETEAKVRALIDGDPFVREGLVTEITVREWNPVAGVLAQEF